jgi:hypothetical protein
MSSSLFQDMPYISLPVQNGDDLKGGGLWPVNNAVVWIAGYRPEAK